MGDKLNLNIIISALIIGVSIFLSVKVLSDNDRYVFRNSETVMVLDKKLGTVFIPSVKTKE